MVVVTDLLFAFATTKKNLSCIAAKVKQFCACNFRIRWRHLRSCFGTVRHQSLSKRCVMLRRGRRVSVLLRSGFPWKTLRIQIQRLLPTSPTQMLQWRPMHRRSRRLQVFLWKWIFRWQLWMSGWSRRWSFTLYQCQWIGFVGFTITWHPRLVDYHLQSWRRNYDSFTRR